jgi:SAM-dependent methyltransferase
VLEIASGTGQHAAWFAAHLDVDWQPTDVDPDHLRSIAAWRDEGGPRLLPPLRLDVTEPWPIARADAVYCANMVHIAPWACADALVRGAAAVLPPGGPLVMYGPFRRRGVPTAPSNEDFDASLRARDPAWGVRDLEAIDALAADVGLVRTRVAELPANNVAVVWRRAPSGRA